MSYVVVLPFAYAPYYEECIKTVKIPRVNMLEIDNTDPKTNLGVMRSHNIGTDFMKKRGADWLIVMSAAIRFGERGGLDFVQALEDHPKHQVLECAGVYGWHLIAFHKDLLEKVGRWDENFSPYGFDDIDMSLRIQKAYSYDARYELQQGSQGVKWDKADGIDVEDSTMGHSIKLANIYAPADPLIDYFREKWNRHPGASQEDSFDTPFGDLANDIRYWPQAPNGGRWDD